MDFWLEMLTRKSRIPYPILFVLIAFILYLLSIPVMSATNNLDRFFSDPEWIFLQVIGGLSAIAIVFVYRKFADSLDKIRQLVNSKEDFERLKDRLLHRLTHWIYWFPVFFWIVINLLIFINPEMSVWQFYGSYNQLQLIMIFYQIASLPANIFGGMLMYVIPFGLTLAYREICVNTTFNQKQILSEWMAPFSGFRNLITLALLITGIYAVLCLLTYTGAPAFFPYASILVIVVPTLVFPHYYFHVLFSKTQSTQLRSIRQELLGVPIDQEQNLSHRMLLLLEEARIERKKTWLIDIVAVLEILSVALMHVILVETLTLLLHI